DYMMGYEQILNEYNDILLPTDVQKILHTGRNTVYTYLAEGKIKSIMIGGKYRIPILYLLEFIYPDINFEKEAG
ncbi:MAG: helix-turn-helix domain-containing protein, partial [Lachnospiraceae bacterium]|nr:helix-turn-helix domain-containing protein [Lachnospiraceae bacterium]